MNRSRKGRIRKRRTRDEVLSSLTAPFESFRQSLPPFGHGLGLVDGTTAADAVVVHRLLSKFEVPDGKNVKARREASIRKLIDHDVPFSFSHTDDTEWARLRLHHWFRGFRPTYAFKPPSGASARPNDLEHDILVKLQDIDNWEISPELIDYAFRIVWSNHALKKLVRVTFRKHFCLRVMNPIFRLKVGLCGYKIFKEQFKALLTINAVSRLETVPKNNMEDRTITCEPLWNMICQLSFMADMRRHVNGTLGYNLNTRGELHKTLLPHAVATIDLKRASDLLHKTVIEGIWPSHMWKHLDRLRPKILEYETAGIKEYHTLEMFAPMGSGITFDVMTFTFLALLRFDKSASVFGDDIIVKRENAGRAISVLEQVGCVINEAKSFVDGKFRESCGGMYHDDVGYILSYDLKYPTNIAEMVLFVNKIHEIVLKGQISFELEGLLLEVRDKLVALLPRDVFGGKEKEPLNHHLVWGLSNKPSDHGVARALSVMWQRPVTLKRAVSIETASSAIRLSEALRWFGITLRHSDQAKRKETTIRRRLVDEWGCGLVSAVPLLPIHTMDA